jgi:tetratricopeptide (TPR) repeat protein
MILKKYTFLFWSLCLVQGLAAQYVTGYEINGYEIDVSQRASIVLNFNSAVTAFSVSEKNAPYALSLLDTKTLKIETLREVKKPYTLSVAEGERKHNFVIIYKDSIDFSKQIQDFSDLNTLKAIADSLQHKSDLEAQALLHQKNLFDSLASAADSALTDSNFDNALVDYQKALNISLVDTSGYYYVRQQINYLKKAIPLRNARNEEIKREEEHASEVTYAIDLYNRAQDSVNAGNYNDALTYFRQFISFMDSTSLTSDEYDFGKLVVYSKKKAASIQASIDTIRARQLRGDTLRPQPPIVKNLAPIVVIYYPNPKDPKLDPIYLKYPDIDFHSPPDNQLFDKIDLSQRTKLESSDIKGAKPVYIAETDNNGIRLSCDNLIFKDAKLYIKLTVYNLTPSEFLTGNMLLVKKEYSSSIGILPVYVSAYPIILPNQQKTIVYVCDYQPVAPDGILEFEVNDRLNKTKVKITISGSVYNREQQKFSKPN